MLKSITRILLSALLFVGLLAVPVQAAQNIELDGKSLTLADLMAIASNQATVSINEQCMQELATSHQLLIDFAIEGRPVYGLTVGVGLNKDKPIFVGKGGKRSLSPEVMDLSKQFNHNALRAHSAGVGPDMSPEMVRMVMALRLNTMLAGKTGAQPYVAELYKEFLNKNIIPVVPSRGTVGEGDITLAPHIGLVMIGEWQALYDGKVQDGAAVMQQAGLTLLEPFGKDALSILSTNAPAMAQVAQALYEAERFLGTASTVYGLSLEGLNGNVAPFLEDVAAVHPFPAFVQESARLRDLLAGSYLWKKHPGRALQDPLAFRTSAYVLGEAKSALAEAIGLLQLQMNSSDDNPAVILKKASAQDLPEQVRDYYLSLENSTGFVYPTSNFEPLPVVLQLEKLQIALAHVSHNIAMRTIHLSDPHFTGLSRFLAADNIAINFGAIQKPFTALHVENLALAQPVSMLGLPLAGDIEDTYTNSQFVASRLHQQVENLFVMSGLELFHSAQAIDLRLRTDKLALGKATGQLYEQYRKVVPFVSKDRPFTPDIATSADFLRNYH